VHNPRSGPGPDRSSNTRRTHRVGETKDGADANKEVGGEPVDPAVTCIPLYGGRARIVHRNTHPMVQGRSTHRPIRAMRTRAVGLHRPTGGYAHHAARVDHTEDRCRYKYRKDRRAVPAAVNVRGLAYVIPGSVPQTGQEGDEQNHAYRKKDERRGSDSGPWSRRPTAT
jgi:hypothetical protein